MDVNSSYANGRRPASGNSRAVPKFIAPAQLRKLRGGDQVAAVCYRVSERGIEFLLVRTRGGRWTFPKGSAEPGLTHAQAAALEAYEEAGVHGRIEETAFARYVRGSRGGEGRREERPVSVHAHLCEVTRLARPQESKRRPTWFCIDKAKRQLQADRKVEDAHELTQVVDRAVSRIERLRYLAAAPPDSLQQVHLEYLAEPVRQVSSTAFVRYFRRIGQTGAAPVELAVNAQVSKVLRFSAPKGTRRTPLLLQAGKEMKTVTDGKKKHRSQPGE